MQNIFIPKTSNTPELNFNFSEGVFSIEGQSLPDDAEQFYGEVVNELSQYAQNPCSSTVLKLKLDYFNFSSSKSILTILYKLNDVFQNGLAVEVHWFCNSSEEDMVELGQDFATMVDVPFKFLEKKQLAEIH